VEGFEIQGELGRGAMGVVYKALQLGLNRLVAIKMIRYGANAAAEDLVRFLAEAEAVAQIHHPNIVQIYSVAKHAGLPLFVLEYLDGGSLGQRIRQGPLAPKEAAEMLELLAQAMDAAHQRGIIHRDLKPGNVLLDSEGQPKITDFGLAKRFKSSSGLTQSGAVMGTPGYMAPEQASGKSGVVGPAADIYALGAILYEMLTGRPPFKAASSMETMLQVLNDEPVPPSRIQPGLPRDLETICLKCMRNEPSRRYDSALALADDLRRYQNGETILARPVSNAERFGRWCRRHPGVTGLSAALLCALVGGLVAVTLLWRDSEAQRAAAVAAEQQAQQMAAAARDQQIIAEAQSLRAQAEADRAVRQANKANKTAEVLAQMFEATDPLGLGGIPSLKPRGSDIPPALQILRRGAERVKQTLNDEPETQAKLLDTIGGVFCTLGRPDEARPLLERALELADRVLPKDDPELAATLHNLGWLYHQTGDYARAREMYEKALAIRRQHGVADPKALSTTILTLGWLFAGLEQFAEAERLFKEAIDLRVRTHGENHRDTAIAWGGLAAVYLAQGKNLEAIAPYNQAMTTLWQIEGNQGLMESIDLFQKGVIARELPAWARPGFRDDAIEDCLRRALELAKANLHDKHVFVGLVLHELAYTLMRHHKDEEAERYFRDCPKVLQGIGLDHPKATFLFWNFGNLLSRQGKPAEVASLLAEALEARSKRYPPDHYLIAEIRLLQAVLRKVAAPSQVRQLLHEALATFVRSPGPPNRWLGLGVRHLPDCLPASDLCDIACALAHAAAARGESSDERNGYQELAVSALRQAQQKGFHDVERLRHDQDLDKLRGRTDFEKLVGELQRSPVFDSK
jgi:tetratricopeptide (TPR) repeat protein